MFGIVLVILLVHVSIGYNGRGETGWWVGLSSLCSLALFLSWFDMVLPAMCMKKPYFCWL